MMDNRFPMPQARPVWLPGPAAQNQYAVFTHRFAAGGAPVRLRLSCDSRARVTLNGRLCGLALYDGTEDTSWYETFPSLETAAGENVLEVTVWYQGVPTNNYTVGRAQLLYDVTDEASGQLLAASGSGTMCCREAGYRTGEVPGNQTGLVWYYDAAAPRQEPEEAVCLPDDGRQYQPRPIPRQMMEPRQPSAVCAHGYLLPGDPSTFERAFLSACLRTEELDRSRDYYEIWDCGAECTGLLELAAESAGGCRISVGWGEHLDDLRVRSHVGDRFFQTEVVFGPGGGVFRHDFQRIGLRYLELHVHPLGPGETKVTYAGLRPLMYPAADKGSFRCQDGLHQKICSTAVRTLRLCMHEHYEDTPWREQALYAMDSLNQALCGYYAFGEYAFPAASLQMLARGLRDDGYLELRNPGKERVVIPYFTFMWGVGVRDYYLFSGDRTVTQELWPVVRRTVDCRLAEERDGLLPVPGETVYWNFYEWNDLLSGEPIFRDTPLPPRVDALYQTFFLLLLEAAAWLGRQLGDEAYAQQLDQRREVIRAATHQLFWEEQTGAYRTYAYDCGGTFRAGSEPCSKLVQSMAVLTGVAGPAERARILPDLAAGRTDWVDCTLSMMRFQYEALLLEPERYRDAVFADIARIWGSMLLHGATSFWETALGADDFEGAGSLCHGWSAMPVYFYYAYLLGIRPTAPGFAAWTTDGPDNGPAGRCSGTVPTPHGVIHGKASEQ